MHISGLDHREKVLVMLIKIVFEEENSLFVYAITLPFKTNRINIIFDNKEKHLIVLYETHVFWVETTGST
jgi:catabolite regulation protein CreA